MGESCGVSTKKSIAPEGLVSPELIDIFKPAALTIKQIFTNADSYYMIPDYQRPYSWGDEQVERLWDDLFSAMETKIDNYFLGSIILTGPREGRFEVVDGQQRLTTLTILFCVLRDLYLKEDAKIRNTIRSLEDEKYRLNFRLTNQPNIQNEFEQQILNGVKFPKQELTQRQREQAKFINAALIFRAKLLELESQKGAIQQFVDYVLNRVIMITITCSKQSFAFKLFQVLNTTGLDLSPADLIKSHLYGHCQENRREQFVNDWREIEGFAEQIQESVTDLLTHYQYYLLARNPKYSLYEELLDKFKNKDSNDVVYELKEFVKAFMDIYKTETKVLYSFWYLPNQVFWKAILTTAKYTGYPEFEELCCATQRFFYLYWIAGYTTTKIKQLSFNLIGWVKDKRPLKDIYKEIETKFSDDMVFGRALDNLNSEAYGEPWLKSLLVLIEYEQVDSSKPGYIELDNKVHVDHILPEKWGSVQDWKKVWNINQGARWLNKLGNLTLLSGKKNITASNDSFNRKKQIYKHGHGGKVAFEISKPIIEKVNWSEQDVQERHEWLLEEIKKLLLIREKQKLQISAQQENLSEIEKKDVIITGHQVSENDIRATILRIPKEIKLQIGKTKTLVLYFDETTKGHFNIIKDGESVAGVTSIFRKYGLIGTNGQSFPKFSVWREFREGFMVKFIEREAIENSGSR